MLNQLKSNSVMYRLLAIGAIVLLMLVPLSMIQSLVQEREQRSEAAREEMGKQWGGRQDMQGPFVAIPYRLHPVDEEKTVVTGEIYLLPDELSVKGDIKSEKRHRGIYETVLYGADLDFKGSFRVPPVKDLESYLPRAGSIDMGRAALVISIPHMRGLRKASPVQWNGEHLSLVHGTLNSDQEGLQASVPLEFSKPVDFHFTLHLLGNQQLSFIPAGKQTKVELTSNWTGPSFIGSYLPNSRSIGEKGFSAIWDISSLGRSYGQILLDPYNANKEAMEQSSFGVKLINPLDHYHKTERAIKYALLFLTLTFTGFFLFEIFNRYRIHPIQYILVGLGMVLFYALFLSLTEQTPFLFAYMVSSTATVGLITFYSIYVLRNRNRALAMGGFLSGLYVYLYVVLRSEDYALLMGTVGLFLILGLVMFVTRNLDWYSIRS